MSIKLPAHLIVIALLLVALLLLFGFAALHAIHPVAWHALAVDPDVISHSH
jgi:hypothetical protein